MTNTGAPAAEVVQLCKSLADIEQGLRVLKFGIEIGPVIIRCRSVFEPMRLVRFMALIVYRVTCTRLKANEPEGVTDPIAAAPAAHPSADRAHRRRAGSVWSDRNDAGADVAAHRSPAPMPTSTELFRLGL